jgi:hypothetical protein
MQNLIMRAGSLSGFSKINTKKEWLTLLDIKKRCEIEGFRHNIS